MDDNNKKNKFEKLMKKRWAAYTFAACSAVLFYLILSHLGVMFAGIGAFFSLIAPVVYGAVIAYIINPLVNIFDYKVFKKLKNEKTRHGVAVAVALLIVFAFIGVLIGTLIPSLVDSVTSVTSNLENYYETLAKFTADNSEVFSEFNIDLAKMTSSWEDLLVTSADIVSDNIATIVTTSASIGAGATNFVLGLILAIYFLLAKRSLLNGLNRFRRLVMKEETCESHDKFFKRCHNILASFIGFDILDGIIVGVINAVFMLICRMPSVALISVIVGATNLIPTFGPIIGAVIGGVLLVLTNPVQALIFLIFTVILQTFDGYILKPKMFGDTFGVPAVWILVSIIVGGKIFGIAGIVLAIPFAAIVSFIYEEHLVPALEKRRE